MSNEEEVMGNTDLRRLIWSFLRKEAIKRCYNCNKVLVWDKKVCNYTDDVKYLFHYRNEDNSIVSFCMECLFLRLPRCNIT